MKPLCIFLALLFCGSTFSQSPGNDNDIANEDLLEVAYSISNLMSDYHYNPSALTTEEYLVIEKKVKELAQEATTKEAFIKGFNQLWYDGPFSHVRLAMTQTSADQMADYIDSMRVGDQAVTLEWKEKTAILTVNTMTGLDTYERIFAVYKEIAANDTKSLIIDVRNNEGGTFAIVPLVGHLLTDTLDAGYFVSRKWWTNSSVAPNNSDVQGLTPWEGWSIKSFWHDVQEVPLTPVQFKPLNPYFKGPVYVLTSSKSASATEFAADALARVNKVTIIGETTAGEMLSQKMYDLPHGFQLSLPIAEYYSTQNGRIEGKGVQPDIAIDQKKAMDKALSLINEGK